MTIVVWSIGSFSIICNQKKVFLATEPPKTWRLNQERGQIQPSKPEHFSTKLEMTGPGRSVPELVFSRGHRPGSIRISYTKLESNIFQAKKNADVLGMVTVNPSELENHHPINKENQQTQWAMFNSNMSQMTRGNLNPISSHYSPFTIKSTHSETMKNHH